MPCAAFYQRRRNTNSKLLLTTFSKTICDRMPKVRRSRKPPPEGWELIEPTLDELDQKMREGRQTR